MAVRPDGQRGALDSGAALFTFDASQRIRSWNSAAEELTGIVAETVIGKYCWAVLCGQDQQGAPICHPSCSHHRMLCARWPVAPVPMVIRTATGLKSVHVATVSVSGSSLFAAVLLDLARDGAVAGSPAEDRGPALTPRQRTVLAMLSQGRQAKSIAAELHLSEMTVRNHVRGVLRALGCHSQLEAVAEARRRGLIEINPPQDMGRPITAKAEAPPEGSAPGDRARRGAAGRVRPRADVT